MKSIQVKIRSGIWLQAGEEEIVRRIAEIVVGSVRAAAPESGCTQQAGGYAWCLCAGDNDWFAGHLVPVELGGRPAATLEVTYRYGGGGNAEMMEALRILLNWQFS